MTTSLRLLVISGLVALHALSGCAVPSSASTEETAEAAQASASGAPVALVQAHGGGCHSGGGSSQCYRERFYVVVENRDEDKRVAIHARGRNGQWSDFGATFQERLPNGLEMWMAEAPNGFGDVGEFVVRYDVGGRTYWDNNRGKNYVMSGPVLGSEYPVKLSSASIGSSFTGYLQLSNLGYDKDVSVVYSFDAWRTVETVKAKPYWGPTAGGIEGWKFDVDPRGAKRAEFAIRYRVNGAEYWDNNFGRNHVAE